MARRSGPHDQLVVPTTTDPKWCESASLLLERLSDLGGRYRSLAENAVILVSAETADVPTAVLQQRVDGLRERGVGRDSLTIPQRQGPQGHGHQLRRARRADQARLARCGRLHRPRPVSGTDETMGAASRRKAERRATAQGVTGPYWHGGAPGRKVGDILLSRRAAEAQHAVSTTHGLQKGYAFGITDPDRVYFSSRRDFARSFAARQITSDRESGIVFQRGSLYRVEPIGAVEPDPDFSGSDVSWCAPAARVTAVEEGEVIMSIFDSAAHAGPFMAWTDMTPMYTEDGFLLPSVPMREQGMTAAELRVVYPPWTPHELLDAELRHLPDPTRHGPTDFPDVLMRAADSVIVWRRHRLRQSALHDAGAVLRIAEHSDYDAVNALLGVELVRPVTPGDPRRVVVAVDADSARVVGAVVSTLSGNGSRNLGNNRRDRRRSGSPAHRRRIRARRHRPAPAPRSPAHGRGPDPSRHRPVLRPGRLYCPPTRRPPLHPHGGHHLQTPDRARSRLVLPRRTDGDQHAPGASPEDLPGRTEIRHTGRSRAAVLIWPTSCVYAVN